MSRLKLYNTLSRKIEEFEPLNPPKVGMYTCGPTVYDYPHVGNWRTFVFEDILRRVLIYNGYKVTQVMNATDVGHLTGDNVGVADEGEDRMEKAAKREKKDIWEVAKFYIDDFLKARDLLNIEAPEYFVRATDHITDQIDLIERLIDKGLAYVTPTGVFFDVLKLGDYGKLGRQKLTDKRVATREELVDDKTKHNPADFALWKLSRSEDRRQMEWESPWGRGFPGWHIECSAMSMKYLGESFDIHAGGVDHIAIHHTNEIAQSEGATGKPLARYWVHGEFLTVDGGRMGKSLGNAYTLHDVVAKKFDPLALRYLYLSAHYRTVLNFTWEALGAAQSALSNLKFKISNLKLGNTNIGCAGYEQDFLDAINNDLNMPQALAVVWKLVDDNEMPARARLTSLLRFDKVLGLKLDLTDVTEFPDRVKKLLKKREKLRKAGKFEEADKIREEILKMGYTVEDDHL